MSTLTHDELPRLSTQLAAVREICLARRDWITTPELVELLRARGIAATESGITARLRSLRDPKFGGYRVDCEKIPGRSLRRYRVIPTTPTQETLW